MSNVTQTFIFIELSETADGFVKIRPVIETENVFIQNEPA